MIFTTRGELFQNNYNQENTLIDLLDKKLRYCWSFKTVTTQVKITSYYLINKQRKGKPGSFTTNIGSPTNPPQISLYGKSGPSVCQSPTPGWHPTVMNYKPTGDS